MANVPNTTSFTLQDVYNSVSSHASSTSGNLVSCFDNAISEYFDPTYNNDTYNGSPLQGMKRFRNYTPVLPIYATISMSYSLVSNPYPGVYNYSGNIVVNATQSFNGGFYFSLDFLSGSIPSGQSEARSVSLTISRPFPFLGYNFNTTGEGSSTEYTQSFASGTTTIPFTFTFVNDNWNYPRPSSSFRLKLLAGSGTSLSVPNSTSTNGTTAVESILGITTTFFIYTEVLTSTNNGTYNSIDDGAVNTISNKSGEMIYLKLSRQNGFTYTANNGYKTSQVTESYNSSGSDVFFASISLDGNSINYIGNTYTGNSSHIESLDAITNDWFYFRYALVNRSGNNTQFSYNLTPLKYCDFVPVSYSQNISSVLAYDHILFIHSLTTTAVYPGISTTIEIDVPRIIPSTSSLSVSDTYVYNVVAHCPNGGTIRITWNDQNEYFGELILYDGEYHQMNPGNFICSNGFSNSSGLTSIRSASTSATSMTTRFIQAPNAWVEFVPVSGVTVSSEFPYKFNADGLVY